MVNAGQFKPAIKESAVLQPSDMVAIGDSTPQPKYEYIYTFLLIINSTATIQERHARSSNLSFADGHADSIPYAKLMDNSEVNRRRWNIDHEPHFEVPF